jgi:hypothetical protein
MAPAVTVDVTLTHSGTYSGLKSDTFRLATPTHVDRRINNRAAAAAPAGPEQQQEEAAVLQASSSSSSSSSLQDATFDQLCNSGSAWTWSNCLVKLYRHTFGLLKQIYLIFMTLSLRTNHLMVSTSLWLRHSRRNSRSIVCRLLLAAAAMRYKQDLGCYGIVCCSPM